MLINKVNPLHKICCCYITRLLIDKIILYLSDNLRMAETFPNSNQLLVCSDAKCSMYMEIHIFQKKSMAIMNIIFFVTFMEIFAINVHATFTMPIISLHVTYCIRYHQISAQCKLISFFLAPVG